MKHKKKAVGGEFFLLIIILGGIIMAFSIIYTSYFSKALKEDADVKMCELSVIAQAKSKVADQSIVSLKCPRRYIKFHEDGIYLNDKYVRKDRYTYDELDDDAFNSVIAEELRTCWGKMGAGELDVFKQNFIEVERVCVLCSEVVFDEGVEKEEFSDLIGYLKTEKMPKSDQYYYNYLINEQKDSYFNLPYLGSFPWTHLLRDEGDTNLIEKEEYKEKSEGLTFDSSKKHIIFFLGVKTGTFNEKLKAFESSYYISIGSPEDLVNECDRLQN